MNGHIRLCREPFRKLVQRFPPRQRSDASAFWLESLMRANWECGENATVRDRVVVERGQFVFGIKEMGEFLGLSFQTFRTIRDVFVTLSELTIKSTNRGSIATIVNYNTYIGDKTENDKQTNKEVTSNQQATNNLKDSKGSKDSKEGTSLNTHVGLENPEPPPKSDPPPPPPEPDPLPSSEVIEIVSQYNEKIHKLAKLTPGARKKIQTRLKTYNKTELLKAIDNFSKDDWWMQNNGKRGMEWFFHSDDRMEQLVHLIPRISQTSLISKSTFTCQNGHPGMKVGDAGKVRCTICNQWQDVGYCKREA